MRKLVVAVGCAVAVALAPGARADDAGATRAVMTCDRVEGPGRVRCEVEARVEPGESITWGDVALVRTPPFVTALRGRIGPREATLREPQTWRWALAIVARDRGTGEVEATVRLVVCAAGRCAPREVATTARVVAGE